MATGRSSDRKGLVRDAVLAAAEPVSISDLGALCPDMVRRTLQRYLGQLVDEGVIERTGGGATIRYQRPGGATRPRLSFAPDRPEGTERPGPFAGIPLAPDAEEVLHLVTRPQSQRSPVGYRVDWLEDYEPGRSALLPPSALRRLHVLSDTGYADRPAATWGREILQRLLIDLSWASSHLEGNTYTRLDTQELIEKGNVASDREMTETQMILNHKAAIEYMVDHVDELRLTEHTLREFHTLLSENLLGDPMDEGRLRERAVDISGSVYRPLDVPSRIRECLVMILQKATAIPDAIERAFFLLVHLPYLQPFVDVNKRTSRIAANLPLLQRNLCPLTFVDVPPHAYTLAILGVYELTRTELLRDLLLWAYERSARDYGVLRQSHEAPNPLRLRYREVIRRQVRKVVLDPERDPLELVRTTLSEQVPADDLEPVFDLTMDELRRLHEGTLVRYGLHLSEWQQWKHRRIRRATRDGETGN
ncbi:MAG: Fic family protein [Deltaproteobacteria bacterium]|nr:MAG: Fic family protein [Deltaproteobacteria bacterium]